MIYLLFGAIIVLLIMVFGNKSFLKLPTWRIGAGVGSLFCFTAAFFFFAKRAWPLAVVFLVIGLWMAVSARFPRASQRRAAGSAPAKAPKLSEQEARSILGVDENASQDEIKAAYARLIKRAHPDSGGSAGLAAQLNAARDKLLKR